MSGLVELGTVKVGQWFTCDGCTGYKKINDTEVSAMNLKTMVIDGPYPLDCFEASEQVELLIEIKG